MKKATTVKQVLKAVEWILLNVGWTKLANFRDKDGEVIGWSTEDYLDPTRYPDVGSVCINGAVQLINASATLKVRTLELLNKSVPKGFNGSAMGLNDSEKTTRETMVDLVRRAIKKA